MRKLLILLAWLGWCPAVLHATDFDEVKLSCPICKNAFEAACVVSTSYCGGTEEGRPRTMGADVQAVRLATCSKCGYTAFRSGYVGHADVPGRDQVRRIREALRKRPKGVVPPLAARVDLAELCYRARRAPAYRMLDVYLLGAWLSDDEYLDGLAKSYRAKALAAARRAVSDDRFSDALERWHVHHILAVQQSRAGQHGEALAVLDKMIEGIPKDVPRAEAEAARLRKEIIEAGGTLEEPLDSQDQTASPGVRKQESPKASRLRRLRAAWRAADLAAAMLPDLREAAIAYRAVVAQRHLGPDRGWARAEKGASRDRLAWLRVHAARGRAGCVSRALALLRSKEEGVRAEAAAALGRIGLASGAVVTALRQAVKGPGHAVRENAAEALGRLGPAAGAAAADLAGLLTQGPGLSSGALRALGGLGPSAKVAVPALIEMARGDDSDFAYWACQTLAEIGPAAEEAVPALIEMFKNQDGRVLAAEALPYLGPKARAAIPLMVEYLADEECPANIDDALAVFGHAAVDSLVKATRDRREAVRQRAWRVLAAIGPSAAKALPHLVTGRDPILTGTTAKVLVSIGPASVPSLIRCLGSSDPWTQCVAADALGSLGPAARLAVPALAKVVADRSADVRRSAIIALGAMGPDAGAAKDALAARLGAKDIEEAVSAAVSLVHVVPNFAEDRALAARLRTVAERAIQAGTGAVEGHVDLMGAFVLAKCGARERGLRLLVAASKSDVLDRHYAAFGLMGDLGADAGPILPYLTHTAVTTRGLFDTDSPAVESLGALGPAAAEAAEALGRCLRASMTAGPAEALGRIGPAAAPAAGALIKWLRHAGYQGVRLACAEALGRIGPGAARAREALREALADEDGRVRVAAALSLARVVPKSPEGVQALSGLLRHADGRVRLRAARALEELGPGGRGAQRHLRRAAKDEDAVVRRAVMRALTAVRQPASAPTTHPRQPPTTSRRRWDARAGGFF